MEVKKIVDRSYVNDKKVAGQKGINETQTESPTLQVPKGWCRISLVAPTLNSFRPKKSA